MKKYLNPKYDLPFKRVFGEHKNLCISLINSMIPFDNGHEVVGVEYLSNELLPALDILKNSAVDVRCQDSSGRHFIVEMQLNWSNTFKKRVLHNASKVYVMQLDTGQKVDLLQPVYSLNFVNHVFEPEASMTKEYHHHYKIVNIMHTEKQIEGLEFVFVELPKFKPENRAEKKLHELWLRFLTEIDEDTRETPSELLACPETEEALQYIERSAYTREQFDAYLSHKATAYFAVQMQEEELKKGREIGLKEGEEIGLVKGEAKAVTAMTRNALAAGLPVDTIMQLTGLTAEQIEGIKQLIS